MRSPLVMLGGVLSSLLYLGLAVLGWGGFAAFFAEPARIALTVVLALMLAAAMATQVNLSTGVREDRSNRWIIAALGVLGLISGWLPAYTERMEIWTLDGDTLRWVGVVLFGLGGVLRLAPVFVLGHRFSGLVAIQPGHRLVTTGLYGVIRHPSYLGLLVIALGWGLAFRSGPGVLLAVLSLVPVLARIRAEEAMLLSEFGAEYEAYRAHTSRLIPGVF